MRGEMSKEVRESFKENFCRSNFIIVSKESIKIFGGNKGGNRAIFLAYLRDIERYALEVKNADIFFCTYSKIQADIGFDERLIIQCFKYFRELGIVELVKYDRVSRLNFYRINYDRIADIFWENGYFDEKVEEKPDDLARAIRGMQEDSYDTAITEYKKMNAKNVGRVTHENEVTLKSVGVIPTNMQGVTLKSEGLIITNNTITNNNRTNIKENIFLTENIKESSFLKTRKNSLKSQKEIHKENMLKYAKEKYEECRTKPTASLNLWLEFIESKASVLQKKRKELTTRAIDMNFNELFKLQEIGVDCIERLKKAIGEQWQGIWFDKDEDKFKKHGGFRFQVNHKEFGKPDDDYNDPFAHCTTYINTNIIEEGKRDGNK